MKDSMNKKFLVTGATGFLGKRVVTQLMKRGLPVVATDVNVAGESEGLLSSVDNQKLDRGQLAIHELDISRLEDIQQIVSEYGVTNLICCGYIMSNLIDDDPVRAVEVNIGGTTNLFEITLRNGLDRMLFLSSQSVYGVSQKLYGDRPVNEDDYCGLQHQHFTYAVMKQLNEFMGTQYIRKHGISIACTRPSIVFGYGRKRSSLMWAEDMITAPALGESALINFPEDNRDDWIYVDDCAEQLILLSLKPELEHFVYNSGGETVSGGEMADIVREFIPDADIRFDNGQPYTPFIDYMDDGRIRKELGFEPRRLREAVKAHINEARLDNNLSQIN